MKLKIINVAILALGLNLPLASIADTTQSTDQSTPSSATEPVSQETLLSQPNQSDSAILAWANSTAMAILTYNFENYREKL
jgi:intracellular multiplication protein IcmL